MGLSGFGHPELLVTGMPSEVAGRLLIETGKRSAPATGCGPVPALQLVWSDPAGRQPWEPGSALAARLQPLYRNPATRVGDTDL